MKYLFKFIRVFFALVSRQSTALSSATQHSVPAGSVESGERSVLAPSADPAMCGTQREAIF